ncbi:MAG: M1 family metallopeptidase, partial [Candidatus Zixiibacteriota bacterium]
FGTEILTFRNTSKSSVETLFLHLYPNAFQSDTTTFMKESLFPDEIKKRGEHRGYMEIRKISLSSGYDLTKEKIIDETIMKLPLRKPLPPQDTISLGIEFIVKLPQILARMGYSGNSFVVGQWFPKMAVLEEEGGWNAHQYHAISEFFADFGTYDVSITLPLEYAISATGYLQGERVNSDSTKTLVYHAEDIHDFAWVADPDYLISERMVDGVELVFLYKPEHKKKVQRIMDAAEFALKYYSSFFGSYHYKRFVMADAQVGFGGGAMEYPMLIMISPSGLPTERIKLDEMVVFHEIAHQWWYGMVASNEVEEAWLDEGFAVWSQRKAFEEKSGATANLVNLWGIKIGDEDLAKLGYLLDPQSDRIVKNSWEFRDFLSYRANVYYKASLLLQTLENLLGEEKMKGLLREYFRRYKFRHPKTEDFIQLACEFSGENLKPFFSQLLFGTGVCDYQVGRIKSTPLKEEGKQRIYQTKVLLNRLGEIKIPVEILIELEDGEQIERTWDGQERWHKLEVETKSRIKSVTIDPENKIILDINVNNNSLTTKSQDSVIFELCSQYLFWMETFVQWITSF